MMQRQGDGTKINHPTLAHIIRINQSQKSMRERYGKTCKRRQFALVAFASKYVEFGS